jgi:hypothetical protein
VRAYQAFHMDTRGWQDIAYSSLVCPHGVRYEGRGHDVRTAANGTTAGNNASHATCYIAGDGDPLTDPAKAAYADESRRLDGLTKGHRDWKPTACPGDPLYRWVHSGQPIPQEDDMPLTNADKPIIKSAVAEQLDAEAVKVNGISTFDQLIELTYQYARDAKRDSAKALAAIAGLDLTAEVDPAAIAAAITAAGVKDAVLDALREGTG